jgi:hypothetical protein
MARKTRKLGDGLRLEVLPPAQRKLWKELGTTPSQFILYGGTAIALRLGHRQSVDFDFFALQKIDPNQLLATVPYLADAIVDDQTEGSLTCRVKRGKLVSLSFFGLPNLNSVAPPDEVKHPAIKLASMLDLAGMKMAVVVQRARAKDYLDVHSILTMTGITLLDALAAATLIYGPQFNPMLTLKALSYFAEAEVAALPEVVKRELDRAAKSVNRTKLPARVAELRDTMP